MFSNHPKGLYILFFVSLFERMAYYILFAILILSLQTEYGFSSKIPGIIYAFFLFGVYSLGIAGGFLADRKLGYTRSCKIGLILMLSGFIFLSVPLNSMFFVCFSLFVLAVGNGFYKSNLVALLGNFYEAEEYKNKQDAGFNIFYMGINLGATFSPFLAYFAGRYVMLLQGFFYDGRLQEQATLFLTNNLKDTSELKNMIYQQIQTIPADLTSFCQKYLDAVSLGYHAAYGIAAVAMVISVIIFFIFRTYLKGYDTVKSKVENINYVLTGNDKERVQVLLIVMLVVMFFWMSFYQNGFTLTLFANNYTEGKVPPFTFLFFDLPSVLMMMPVFVSAAILISRQNRFFKMGSLLASVISILVLYFRYRSFEALSPIKAEIYQYFNPFFCIVLTPLLVIVFSRMKEKEPSTPAKIGIGMIITAVSFAVIMAGSYGLQSPKILGGRISPVLVSPWWLIVVYFTTTLAELFLSPIGMSFVSKVSPIHLKGVMQGAWFGTMAAGNLLSGLIGTFLWNTLELWQFFGIFVVTSLVSAVFVFIMIKRIKRIAG